MKAFTESRNATELVTAESAADRRAKLSHTHNPNVNRLCNRMYVYEPLDKWKRVGGIWLSKRKKKEEKKTKQYMEHDQGAPSRF